MSRLQTMAETRPDDDDDIPSFLLEPSSPEGDSSDFIDVQYSAVDVDIAKQGPAPANVSFQPIQIEELLREQLVDGFCTEICRRLNGGEVLPFDIDDEGLLTRSSGRGNQIVIPQCLKERVLLINHYSLLNGHPGGRKLYHKIRKDFYWPALAVDCYVTVRRCPHCAPNGITLRRNVEKLQLSEQPHH